MFLIERVLLLEVPLYLLHTCGESYKRSFTLIFGSNIYPKLQFVWGFISLYTKINMLTKFVEKVFRQCGYFVVILCPPAV